MAIFMVKTDDNVPSTFIEGLFYFANFKYNLWMVVQMPCFDVIQNNVLAQWKETSVAFGDISSSLPNNQMREKSLNTKRLNLLWNLKMY